MDTRRDVFQAIADPTRRQIISLLATRSMNLNSLSDHFSVSRPAISQHVKVLIECGIVNATQLGRERHCEVRLDKLRDVAEWVDQYRRFWTHKLDALEKFLDRKHPVTGRKKIANQKRSSKKP